jgi:hypothetical protein
MSITIFHCLLTWNFQGSTVTIVRMVLTLPVLNQLQWASRRQGGSKRTTDVHCSIEADVHSLATVLLSLAPEPAVHTKTFEQQTAIVSCRLSASKTPSQASPVPHICASCTASCLMIFGSVVETAQQSRAEQNST